jgi:subtilisin family serine protease
MKDNQTALKKYFMVGALLLFSLLATPPAQAAQAGARLVVRDSLGLPGIKLVCLLLRCQVQQGLGDPQGQLFVVTFPAILNPVTALLQLHLGLPGIVSVEIDQPVKTQSPNSNLPPFYLTDKVPTSYYGTTVWHGYVVQPATRLIRADAARSSFNVTGSGVTVAVIDTGVDPTHPALQGVLLTGYDFTRNQNGGSERTDVSGVTPNSNTATAANVNQRTVAVLDQRTVAVLDDDKYAAFGHGTMTAGLVHLVAPQAKIMPLKAFQADGTAHNSDILRAIYYAVKNDADVINMSFNYTSYSPELASAIRYANSNGVTSVASAGNDGQYTVTYPGGLAGVVDVASTSNDDIQSVFTNYGAPPVWLAAPGEGVVTTYPFNTYAAGWGTSFSTPLVAGTAALMKGAHGNCPTTLVPAGLARADWISDIDLGFGRLDTYNAVQACHRY